MYPGWYVHTACSVTTWDGTDMPRGESPVVSNSQQLCSVQTPIVNPTSLIRAAAGQRERVEIRVWGKSMRCGRVGGGVKWGLLGVYFTLLSSLLRPHFKHLCIGNAHIGLCSVYPHQSVRDNISQRGECYYESHHPHQEDHISYHWLLTDCEPSSLPSLSHLGQALMAELLTQ